jgi:hypothetical protein
MVYAVCLSVRAAFHAASNDSPGLPGGINEHGTALQGVKYLPAIGHFW